MASISQPSEGQRNSVIDHPDRSWNSVWKEFYKTGLSQRQYDSAKVTMDLKKKEKEKYVWHT